MPAGRSTCAEPRFPVLVNNRAHKHKCSSAAKSSCASLQGLQGKEWSPRHACPASKEHATACRCCSSSAAKWCWAAPLAVPLGLGPAAAASATPRCWEARPSSWAGSAAAAAWCCRCSSAEDAASACQAACCAAGSASPPLPGKSWLAAADMACRWCSRSRCAAIQSTPPACSGGATCCRSCCSCSRHSASSCAKRASSAASCSCMRPAGRSIINAKRNMHDTDTGRCRGLT